MEESMDLEHVVAIFGHPYDVNGQVTDTMAAVAVASHGWPSYHPN